MPRSFLRRAIRKPREDEEDYSPRINFRLFGQWDQTMNIIKRLEPEIKQSSIKAQLKVAKVISALVRRHLRDQDLGWQVLSYKYAAKKAEMGLSDNTLMAYQTYYKNIKVWRSGNRHLVNIGVKRGIYTTELSGKKSKMDVATIAAIHEFSSGRKIPKRPLWNPSIEEIGGADGIKKMYINSLLWHLREKGIPVKKMSTGFGINIDGQNIKL